jgi:hypothetical protein
VSFGISALDRSAKLSYYIFEGLLLGIVAGKSIEISAISGGGQAAPKTLLPTPRTTHDWVVGELRIDLE